MKYIAETGLPGTFSLFPNKMIHFFNDQSPSNVTCRDTNLVLDSATQSWTGQKSGTSNVYPLSNITKR